LPDIRKPAHKAGFFISGWVLAVLHFAMRKLVLFLLLSSSALAQKYDVKIVQRQTADTTYSYHLAGYATSNSTGNADCSGTATYTSSTTANINTNCSTTGTTNTTYMAPRNVSYSVTGATFSLLLPDGRIAVVNCPSKWRPGPGEGGLYSRRSCRIPIVDDLQAEFKGKNAKLSWAVSLDGKKRDSETYAVLAVLPKKP
jgi:hypothetical protein